MTIESDLDLTDESDTELEESNIKISRNQIVPELVIIS